MAKRRESYRIDIRDQRLPGGRFTCSARTTSAPEFRKREAAVRSLIEAGALDVLARITASGPERLHVADVATAVGKGEVDALRVAKESRLLLGATIDRLRQRKEATRTKGTQAQVAATVKQLEAAFGVLRNKLKGVERDVDISTISTERCEAWLHGPKQGGKPWAPATQGVKRAYAKEVWDLAIEQEAEAAERENRKVRMRRNPWDQIEAAPIHPTRVIFLTAPERDALLAKLEGTPLRAFMAVGYLGGLRVEEAVYLRTDVDVDLVTGHLHIQSRPGEFDWTTKNKKSRSVPINRTLRAILEDHIARGYAGQRFFFHAARWDRPLGTGTSWEWWVEAYEAAGIKHGRSEVDAVVYHTGRHTFASLLVQQGVSPLIVAELLGNKYQEVVDTYGHLAPHNLADAVKLLESGSVSTESSTVANEE